MEKGSGISLMRQGMRNVKFRIFCMLLFLCLFLFSCTSDPYDTGDTSLSYMRADFSDVYTDGTGLACSAMTDDGDSIIFDNKFKCGWECKPDSVYRVLLYHNLLEGMSSSPIAMSQVYVLYPFTVTETTEMYTDPVVFESAWKSGNGRYLNLGLYLKTGQADGIDARHTIGVACEKIVVNDDGTRTVYLTLYHEQNNVPEYYSTRLYASIPMSVFKHGDIIRISVNTYDGLVEKEFDY